MADGDLERERELFDRRDTHSSPPLQTRKRPSDVGGDEEGMKRRRMDQPGGSDSPPSTLRILVRNQDAGGIIGKGGDNIKRLRKQYDCQVVLPDSAGAPERVMTVMGAIYSCLGVLGEVLPKLGEEELHHGNPDAMLEVQVLIPQPFMGTIIGTGGAKIKDLRMNTRASIKIFSEPMPNSNERSIQLMGTRDQIIQCASHFLEEISKKEPREPIYLYEPGSVQFLGGEAPFPPRGHGTGAFRGMRGRGGPPRGRGGFHGNMPPPGGSQWSPQYRGRGRGHMGGSRGGQGPGRGMYPRNTINRGPPVPTPPTHTSTPSQPPYRAPPPLVPPTGTPAAPIPPSHPQQPLFGMTPPSQPQPQPPTQSLFQQQPLPSFSAPSVGYGMSQPPVGYTTAQPRPSQSTTTHVTPPSMAPTPSLMPPSVYVPVAPTGQTHMTTPTATPPMALPPSQPVQSYIPSTQHAPQQLTQHAPQQLTQHAPQQLTQQAPQQLTQQAPQQLTQQAPQQLTQQAPQQLTQQQTQQVTIPYEFADAIYGVNGATLQQIKAQSSCEIAIEDAKPGSMERIITIAGTPNGIQFAQQLMQNCVRQHHPHV